jgi:hypothetical protein
MWMCVKPGYQASGERREEEGRKSEGDVQGKSQATTLATPQQGAGHGADDK